MYVDRGGNNTTSAAGALERGPRQRNLSQTVVDEGVAMEVGGEGVLDEGGEVGGGSGVEDRSDSGVESGGEGHGDESPRAALDDPDTEGDAGPGEGSGLLGGNVDDVVDVGRASAFTEHELQQWLLYENPAWLKGLDGEPSGLGLKEMVTGVLALGQKHGLSNEAMKEFMSFFNSSVAAAGVLNSAMPTTWDQVLKRLEGVLEKATKWCDCDAIEVCIDVCCCLSSF